MTDTPTAKNALVRKVNERPQSIGAGDPRLALPLFTLGETARYVGVAPAVVRHWAGRTRSTPPLITSLPTVGRGHPTVPFIGLVEAYVLVVLRRAGVRTAEVRLTVTALRRAIGVPHPLASERLVGHPAGVTHADVVCAGLARVGYASEGWATSLRLLVYEPAEVVVDPRRAFGCPLVVQGGARVEDLIDRFCAGDSIADIANDFGVPTSDVEAALRATTRQGPRG